MRRFIGSLPSDVDAKELDALTDLLIAWCRKNGKDPVAIADRCAVILDRFRTGERDPEKLFADL